jgi:cupin superfamily acireductone dioxygenase involved in methionine salvage
MEEIMDRKKFEYLDYLTQHLERNNDRIIMEKETLEKMENSFNEIKPKFKKTLDGYMTNIKIQIDKQKKLIEEAEKKAEEGGEKTEESTADDELPDVDTDKIKAITSIVDEFNNIVAKNFSVYAQYDDFSFANSRSSDKIEEKLNKFFKEHFSGDFQLKNSFENSVLPRIFYLEQRTKFIYSYKILNYMT